MKIEKIAAFSLGNKGGNPAGIVLCNEELDKEQMLNTARNLNYSETAFLIKNDGSFRVRYFSPETEIDFCGHATIACGRVLGQIYGEGNYRLILNNGMINLEVKRDAKDFISSFSSLNTYTKDLNNNVIKILLEIFNLTIDDLNPRFPIKVSNSGNNHPIIFLKNREILSRMKYDFERAKIFMRKENFVTISLLYAENKSLYHSRNAFAYGGVY